MSHSFPIKNQIQQKKVGTTRKILEQQQSPLRIFFGIENVPLRIMGIRCLLSEVLLNSQKEKGLPEYSE